MSKSDMAPFIEIEQDPDQTDSDMIEIIKEKIGEGWSLVNYQWKDGLKIFTFEA
jgi:hypothetical protein